MKSAALNRRAASGSSPLSLSSRWLEAVSDLMRRIRAYNDLRRLDAAALRRITDDPEELDRVIRGHAPRKAQSR